MLLKQAATAFWKKRAAEHECEELKEGVWSEPIQALLRRETNESWTDKHRNVMKNGSWKEDTCGRERMTLGGQAKRSVEAAARKKAQRSTGCTIVRHGWKSETGSQRVLGTLKERCYVVSSRRKQWRKFHVSVRRWESDRHRSWGVPVEGLGHVATDGSLFGVSGRWEACGRSVVQLDHDEEMGPMLGMYGTLGC